MKSFKYTVMKKLILLLILAAAWSCDDLYVVPETQYHIPQGQHQSKVVNSLGDKVRTLKSDYMSFTARFDESARYDLQNNDQGDINKLMGFADANSLHHDNSIRFGWRYSIAKGEVEIFGYAYQDGVRNFKYITDVAIHETADFSIQLTEQSYVLQVNGEEMLEMERMVKNTVGVYYLLFPYFGGNEPAPHDINIFVKENF